MNKPKLTTAIATEMVLQIEALQEQIDAIYSKATLEYAGSNAASEIREAIKSRKTVRDEQGFADGILAGFDVEDEL